MATVDVTGHVSAHETRHPMTWVAYTLVVLIIPALGMTVTFMAQHQTAAALVSGVALVAILVGAVTTYSAMSRRLHHSPLLPDDTGAERDRYLAKYRRG